MKTIAYFVTDSGFGHITRSVAIIANILSNSDYNVLIISNKDQDNHARIGLLDYEKRVSFAIADTDANSVFYNNSLKVDVESTTAAVRTYMENLDDYIEDTYNLLKGLDITTVVTDISILGIMVAKKLRAKVIGISNYTWYNRFKSLGLDEDILDFYQKWYNKLDILLRFQFPDDMTGISCPIEDVGLVCREVDMMSSSDYKHRYWPAIYLSIGQVEKKKEVFEVDFPQGTIFATGAIEITGSTYLLKLPQRVSHTQDYIAASSLALIKGGWSSVAECLILGIPFGILEQGDTEDEELVNKLFDEKLAFKTTEDELRNFSIKDLNIKSTKLIKKRFPNDAEHISKRIIEISKDSK
jgi:hypothetical protein